MLSSIFRRPHCPLPVLIRVDSYAFWQIRRVLNYESAATWPLGCRSQLLCLCVYVVVSTNENEWMSEWVNEWMSEWVNGWMGEWVNGWMGEWVNGWMGEWVNEWMSEWVNEWMSEWVNKWMSEWVNEWMSMCTSVYMYMHDACICIWSLLDHVHMYVCIRVRAYVRASVRRVTWGKTDTAPRLICQTSEYKLALNSRTWCCYLANTLTDRKTKRY